MNQKGITVGCEMFGPLKIIPCPGGPLFCVKDVALALGYRCPWTAIRRVVKDRGRSVRVKTPNGSRYTQFITVGDVRKFARRSTKPVAKEFEEWVTQTVVPHVEKRLKEMEA